MMHCVSTTKSIGLVCWLTLISATPTHAAVTEEARPLAGGFTSIIINGGIDLTVSQGVTTDLRLKGESADLARITTTINGKQLQLTRESRAGTALPFASGTTLQANLSLPQLERLSVNGSGDVTINRFDMRDNEAALDVNGSGDIHASELLVKLLKVVIKGSGDISVAGQTEAQTVAIVGSGDYKARNLKCRNATISIAGSGDATVRADEALTARIAGSGDISYLGAPKVSTKIAGSGEVRRIDDK